MAEPKTARMASHGLRLIRDRLHGVVDQEAISSEEVDEMIDDLSTAIATLMDYNRKTIKLNEVLRSVRDALHSGS